MNPSWFLHCLLFHTALIIPAIASNILLVPWSILYNSRLLSILRLGEMMVEDGHDVSLLIPSFLGEQIKSKHFRIIEFEAKPPPAIPAEVMKDPNLSDIGTLSGQTLKAKITVPFGLNLCEGFYSDKKTMKFLKEQHFDLLFTDSIYMLTRAVIDFMDIPTLLYSPDASTFDSDIFYPNLPSFVCSPMQGFCGDKYMPFMTRLQSFLSQIGIYLFYIKAYTDPIDQLRQKYNVNSTVPSRDSYRRHLVIANIDNVMEPLRPRMPHVIPIPGLFVPEAKPLEDSPLKTFVENGKNGIIVMSMGTILKKLGGGLDQIILKVFKQSSLSVVWKQSLQLENVGTNVFLTDWLPQTTLLAHRNTKVFITHGGVHSMYEAAYSGVAVICIPHFLDQFGHCKALTEQLGLGITIDVKNITEDSFKHDLEEVLKPKYRDNAERVQLLLKDQPMKSKDLFLYWVNYTIRHKGAKHLISEAPFEMNILQYWSIDVVLFLLSILFLCVIVFVFILKFILSKLVGQQKSDITKKKKVPTATLR